MNHFFKYFALFALISLSFLHEPDLLFNAKYRDDLFYYLNTAWNFVHNGVFTFDGIHLTNGVHPLWAIVNIAIAFFCKIFGLSKITFFYLVLVVSAIISIFSLKLIEDIYGLLIGKKPPGDFLVFISGIVLSSVYILNGMESVLSIALMLWLLKLILSNKFIESLEFLTVLSLYSISRLDNFLFSLMIIFSLSLAKRNVLWRSTIVVFGTLISVISFNFHFFGRPTPISGSVKGFWRGLIEEYRLGYSNTFLQRVLDFNTYIESARQIFRFTLEILTDFINVISFQGQNFIIGLLLVILIFNLNGYYKKFFKVKLRAELKLFLICLAVFVSAKSIYYSSFSAYKLFEWYFPELALIIGILLYFLLIGALRLNSKSRSIAIGLLVFVSLFSWHFHNTSDREKYYGVMYSDLVKEANRLYPNDVCAGWAAGQLGFQYEGNFINLEGLVADEELLRANQEDKLFDYLVSKNIRCIIQHLPFDLDKQYCALPYYSMQHLRVKSLLENRESIRVIQKNINKHLKTVGYLIEISNQTSKMTRNLNEELININLRKADKAIKRRDILYSNKDAFSVKGLQMNVCKYIRSGERKEMWARLINKNNSNKVLSVGKGVYTIEPAYNCTWDDMIVSIIDENNCNDIKVDMDQIGDVYIDQFYFKKDD